MITLVVWLVLALIYGTNIGQLVHRTPTPNWFERIGR